MPVATCAPPQLHQPCPGTPHLGPLGTPPPPPLPAATAAATTATLTTAATPTLAATAAATAATPPQRAATARRRPQAAAAAATVAPSVAHARTPSRALTPTAARPRARGVCASERQPGAAGRVCARLAASRARGCAPGCRACCSGGQAAPVLTNPPGGEEFWGRRQRYRPRRAWLQGGSIPRAWLWASPQQAAAAGGIAWGAHMACVPRRCSRRVV
jgi:hypothetical protein